MVFILKISFMKKDLFKINEEDRNRILEMHIRATKNKYLFEGDTPTTPTPAPTTPTTPTTPTPAPTTPTTPTTPTPAPAPTTPKRFESATCAGKKPNCQEKVLKIQIRMNDECPSEVLTTKLVEDGLTGPKTMDAWKMCKTKLSPTKMKDDKGNLVPVSTLPKDVVKTTDEKPQPLTPEELEMLKS